MKAFFLIIAAICFFGLVGLIFYYLGKRVLAALKYRFKSIKTSIYWVAYVAGLFFIVFFKTVFFATLLYSLIFYVVFDVVKELLKLIKINVKAKNVLSNINLHGLTALVLALILTVAAAANARYYQVTNYTVQTDKHFNNADNLNIVMISDTHCGTAVKEKELDRIIDGINALKPDVVCLCGDIIDEGTSIELENYSVKKFSEINSRYGVYYINGNHESIDDRERYGEKLEKAGVNVLYDSYVLVDDSFYVVGRNNGMTITGNAVRKPIDELMAGIDTDLPVIILDHAPTATEENDAAGADIQLSGHTHNGQLYPFNYVVALFNDYRYGCYNLNNGTVVVSSGIGTWGYPVRLGSKSEIVQVTLECK